MAQHLDHIRTTPTGPDDRPHTPVSPIPLAQSTYTTPPSARHSRHASLLSSAVGDDPASMSRPASAASDRVSVVSGLTQHFPSNPLSVHPAPAYVAPAGAAQVVSEHRGSIIGTRLSDDDDDDASPTSKKDMTFSEPALALVNQFLDQLLYSFLSSARSTSMVALRPAVTDVLKQRLAREAIASAEEELAELLAGGDDEEEGDGVQEKAVENDRNWDVELVWKRTRLRVMVYIRLGEMEDEDEQRYVQEEQLFHGSERRFSSTSGLVSWAAAIFLTSVLEYVAEQTLQVAGGAAHARVRRQTRSGGVPQTATSNVVVEEHDVEKVALNSTLGRLWRTWRKSLRNHGHSGVAGPIADRGPFTPTSREGMYTAMSNRRNSLGTARDGSVIEESSRPSTAGSADPGNDSPELRYPEHVLAANIPLPIGDGQRDVHEIDVPGLAPDPDVDEQLEEILLSDLAAAAHTALPVSAKDVHEIEVPGLARDIDDEDESQARHVDRMFAAGLPLPMKDEKSDVNEIEVPGLASDPDAQDEPLAATPARRNSFTAPGSIRMPGGMPTPETSQPASPVKEGRGLVRRSSSVPTPVRTPMPVDEGKMPELPAIKAMPAAEQSQAEDSSTQHQGTASDKSSVYSQPEEDNNGQGGIVVGALAGAAAAGTAVAAAVFGSKESEASSEERSAETPALQDEDQPKSTKTDAEIEELDKRKSLMDIKAIAGLQPATPPVTSGRETPEVVEARRVTVRESGVPPTVVRTDSGEKGRPSTESYTLGHRQAPQTEQAAEEISSEEGPQDADAIGVAQTSDVPFTSPGAASPSGAGQDARDKQRPTRVIIGEEAPDSPTVKQVGNSVDTSGNRPRSFSRKSEVSLTDQNRYVAQQLAQQRGIPQTPNGGTNVRQLSSANEEPVGQAAQEHPVLQRMASLKRNKPPMDDRGNTLTSASIRGPEDFDTFVQGGETMKYTLTPEAARSDGSVGLGEIHAQVPMHADYVKKSVPQQASVGAERESHVAPATAHAEALKKLEAGAPAADGREGRSRTAKQAMSSQEQEEEEERRKRQHRRSISRPPTNNTKKHSKSGMMAREPRVQTESTRDFADFIRSTGPDQEASVYPLMKNVSTTSLSSLRSAHINGASASRSSSPAASRTHSLRNGAGDEVVPPVPPIPSTKRGAMQPRGASGATAGNSDLIDFIRSGPKETDKHRISRSVAPFRNTMDSEQFRDMDDRTSSDKPPNLSLNTHNSQSLRSSPRTSANSRSALLSGGGSAATAHPAYSGKPQSLSTPSQSLQPSRAPSTFETEPTKKRYRNKDPYAIDFSDDDDDDLVTALPRTTAPRKEESLVDFLNSMEPPKDTTARKPEPLINPNSAHAQKLIQSARATPRPLHGDGRARSAQSNPGPRPGYAGSVASSLRSAGPPAPSFSTSITAGNAPRAKMVARTTDAPARGRAAQQGGTDDLAAFLRESGPPDDGGGEAGAPAPSVGRGKSGAAAKAGKEKVRRSGFGFFGRTRKKGHLEVA